VGALLEVTGLQKRFGGLVVLDGVSFAAARGEILGIIGPNGAGKTTLFNILSGIYEPDAGAITLDGGPLAGLEVHAVAARGVGRTFQNVKLFANMSVLENVMVGRHCRTRAGLLQALLRPGSARKEERSIREQAVRELEFVGLQDHAALPSSSLPFGKQRLLEIARTLASHPKLILLDEPAAGLNPRETRELGGIIARILERGITLLLVEHDMELVMEVSHRILVLHNGRKICEGTPREVQSHPEVITAYLGEAPAGA